VLSDLVKEIICLRSKINISLLV